MNAKQWFAVKTKPQRERQVSVVLAAKGVEAYLPEIPSQRRSGQRSTATEPLFPGYLFSRLTPQTPEWVAVRSAPGVAYFLGAMGHPSPLPDELIEGIRSRAEARLHGTWKPPFRQGDRVLIEHGPFDGLEAVFDEVLSPTGRVRVFLSFVSRLVPVEVDASVLRRCG